MPQIRLESTFIKLGLQIDKPIQRIEQPKAIQTIEQPSAILEISTEPGWMNIDQSEARAQYGFKPTSQRVFEFANEGKQSVLQGISRRIRQGDELMRIENGGNPVIEHALEAAYKPQKQLAIGWIPSHGSVKLHYEPANIKIEAIPQKPKIDAQIQKPVHDYIPGKVSAYIEQKNSLKIDFVNLFNETI